jgi:hypothetical protein
MPTSILPTSHAATSIAKNGNIPLPFLATFAAHNTKRQVADPRKPAAIQPSRASLPRDNAKSGKNGNVHRPGQLCHLGLPPAFMPGSAVSIPFLHPLPP